MASLPKPVRVSPLIKLCRWTLLIVGIYHGATKRNRLAKIEAVVREEEAACKAKKDQELAVAKEIANEKELIANTPTFVTRFLNKYVESTGRKIRANGKQIAAVVKIFITIASITEIWSDGNVKAGQLSLH
ncbi:hypothetical protein TcasGA2_TC009033 [Tribolium castaneum]|uniref:ATP synthase F(0) complex subunit e, mitochondrial n=1 Tax=Tribolium castaneum TaxID=7070 RepID=D6WPR8_TRICA|nr:hypothetical protein TcasGA2_TC009033 [Tribolium castaneum]